MPRQSTFVLVSAFALALVTACVPEGPGGGSRDVRTSRQPIVDTDVLARAQQWIDVKMPYCGGVNHGTDYICGGTCTRTGAASTPTWDEYRTDCSGFVSWSWGMAGPGYDTAEFAALTVTKEITLDELLPGDALVTHDASTGEGHIFLFDGWKVKNQSLHLMEESTCTGPNDVAHERDSDVTLVDASHLKRSGETRVYTAIRYDKITFDTTGTGGAAGAGGGGGVGGVGTAGSGVAGSTAGSSGAAKGGNAGAGGGPVGASGGPVGASGASSAAGHGASAGSSLGDAGAGAAPGAAGMYGSSGHASADAPPGSTSALSPAQGESEHGGCAVATPATPVPFAWLSLSLSLAGLALARRRRDRAAR